MKVPVFRKRQKAEVTAFLSLIFILMITFVGGIMESASIQVTKNRKRADTNRAIESVFAEYQRDLLEYYDIFALEGSYESGTYEEQRVIERLEWFGAENIDHKVQKIQLLTDNRGKAFYEQILYFMENKYGIDRIKNKEGMTDIWKAQDDKIRDYENEDKNSQNKLESLLESSESTLPTKDNPIESVSQLKKKSLLDLIMPKGMKISEKKVSLPESLSRRGLNHGYGDFSAEAAEVGNLSGLLFGEYLQEHFSSATDQKKDGPLDYELEYIFAGKSSDRENLESVAKRLVGFRFVSNYAYLQGSSSKKAEAEAVALTLCSLAAVPEIAGAVKQAILLAWAFGESVVDIRTLLKNNKVPLVKSDDSWQLSLTSLMEWKSTDQLDDGKESKHGMDYREYLRVLLFLQAKDTVTMRSLDLIEWNMQKKYGKNFFRCDNCISKLKIKSKVALRRGITYQFQTYYGYR